MSTTSDVSRHSPNTWKRVVGVGMRSILAFFLLIASLMVASSVVGGFETPASEDPGLAFVGLLGMGLLMTAALSYPVIRSHWTGWKLVAAVLVAFAGVNPILIQVESVLFLVFLVPIIPADVLPKIIAHGFITALLFSPLIVLIHGKMRGGRDKCAQPGEVAWRPSEWAWKLLLISVAYCCIYFAFGMFVAVPLAGPAFSEYYRDLQLPPWTLLVQMARGAFWALIMVPILRMMKSRGLEAGLAVAMLSSLLTAAPLLAPNEFMPEAMRFAHFFELLLSNFLFGWVIFWLFHRHHDSPLGIFSRRTA